MTSAVWLIVVAGGEGHRFGGFKQFAALRGRPVHEWSITAGRSVASGVVLVVPTGFEDDPRLAGGADLTVPGGTSRSASVRCGLAVVPADAGIVVVHDAARPLASPSLFTSVVDAVRSGADGAVPGVWVADTIKRVAGGRVVSTLDRSDLVRVQTPQAFRRDVLVEAHGSSVDATDDAALVEAVGGVVAVVPGEETNLKITSPEDFDAAGLFLETCPWLAEASRSEA